MNAHAFFALGFLGLMAVSPARADDASGLPGPGFSGDRYTTLWTKSPFAIATPEAAAASQDYSLVGLAQFDGVSYASLVDKQSNEHFVLASDKPVRNLKLVSISHGANGASAVIDRNGEELTLQQEVTAPPSPGAGPVGWQPPPGAMPTPQPFIPGAPLSSVGGVIPPAYMRPPSVHFHRPLTRIPPRPGSPQSMQQQQQQQQPPPQSQ